MKNLILVAICLVSAAAAADLNCTFNHGYFAFREYCPGGNCNRLGIDLRDLHLGEERAPENVESYSFSQISSTDTTPSLAKFHTSVRFGDMSGTIYLEDQGPSYKLQWNIRSDDEGEAPLNFTIADTISEAAMRAFTLFGGPPPAIKFDGAYRVRIAKNGAPEVFWISCKTPPHLEETRRALTGPNVPILNAGIKNGNDGHAIITYPQVLMGGKWKYISDDTDPDLICRLRGYDSTIGADRIQLGWFNSLTNGDQTVVDFSQDQASAEIKYRVRPSATIWREIVCE